MHFRLGERASVYCLMQSEHLLKLYGENKLQFDEMMIMSALH